MRLDRVEIKNFRSVADVTVTFDPRCRVLVGINESGKSSILGALALLDPAQKLRPEDLRDFAPDEDAAQEAYVDFVFTLDHHERAAALNSFDQDVAGDIARHPIVTVDGSAVTLAQFFDSRPEIIESVLIPSGKRLRIGFDLPDGKRYEVSDAWKTPKSTFPDGYPVALEDGEERELNTYKLIHTGTHGRVPQDELEAVTPEILNEWVHSACWAHLKDAVPKCVYWSYSDANLLPGQVDVAKFSATPSSCEPLRQMFGLAGFPDPQKAIAAAGQKPTGMRNLLQRVSTLTTEHMRRVWPEYGSIEIELALNGDKIDAYVQDTFNAYHLARRSDGFKRFVSFLLLVSARVKSAELENVLYLHDEPDTSLHPSGARFLRNELIAMSARNYVVYSTHSPYMIDRENVGRHLIIRKVREVTTASEVTASTITDDEVILNAIGASVFEVLKPANLVFEGWRDKRLFDVALSKPPSAHKRLVTWAKQVGRCHAKGVKDVGRITPVLQLANRGCVIVSDADRPAVEQQREHVDTRGYGTWLRYDELLPHSGVVTGEDFVMPAVIAAVAAAIGEELPGKGELSAADLAVDGGRLARVERWMEQRGVSREDRKRRMNEMKDRLFQALEPSHIERRYYDALEALRARTVPNPGDDGHSVED